MRASVIIAITSLLFSGCVSPDQEEKNAAAAANMFEAFNEHDWQGMASFYCENALFLDPSFGMEYVSKSRTETAEKYAEMEKMFPDIHDEVMGIYPSGDVVAIEFVSTGTMNDSVSFKLPIVSVLTFENGLIVKDATYYDPGNP